MLQELLGRTLLRLQGLLVELVWALVGPFDCRRPSFPFHLAYGREHTCELILLPLAVRHSYIHTSKVQTIQPDTSTHHHNVTDYHP
jgi:hypothetical protein